MIADAFVLLPALMFTELRTITDVTGNPPISPATMFPKPCAISSRFGGEVRCSGSILSTASRFKSVSNDARPNEVCITEVTTKATHFKRYAKRSELIVLGVGSMIAVKIHRNKEACATRETKD